MEAMIASSERSLDALPGDLLTKILSRSDASKPLSLKRLCQLRTVCASFDKAINQTEEVLCLLDQIRYNEMVLVRFLLCSQKVKRLIIMAPTVAFVFSYAFLNLALGHARSLTLLDLTNGVLSLEQGGIHELQRSRSTLPCLESLVLNHCSTSLVEPLRAKYTLQSLRKLVISGAYMNDVSFASLLELCPTLSHLELSQISGLKRLRLDCSRLQLLHWEDGRANLERLDITAPLLIELSLPRFEEVVIDAAALRTLEIKALGRLIPKQTWNLEKLQIGRWGSGWGKDQLVQVLSACESARTVELDFFIEDDETMALSDLLLPLRTVQELTMCNPVTASLSEESQSQLPILANLETLKLGTSEPANLSTICPQFARVSPKLKRLVIDFQGVEYDYAKEHLAFASQLLRQYPNLRMSMDFN